jgi:hypothetical protein
LAALHNFIRIRDPQQSYSQLDDDNLDHTPGGFYAGDDSNIPGGMEVVDEEDGSEATKRRNRIADEMWIQYQQILQQRAAEGTSGDITSDDDDYIEDSSEEEE